MYCLLYKFLHVKDDTWDIHKITNELNSYFEQELLKTPSEKQKMCIICHKWELLNVGLMSIISSLAYLLIQNRIEHLIYLSKFWYFQ